MCFKKLKTKIMFKFIDKMIADVVDRLKLKSPKWYIAIGVVLTFLKTGIGNDAALSLAWILERLGIDATKEYLGDTIDGWLTYFIAFFVTTSTTAYLSSTKRKEKKIEESKIARMKVDEEFADRSASAT